MKVTSLRSIERLLTPSAERTVDGEIEKIDRGQVDFASRSHHCRSSLNFQRCLKRQLISCQIRRRW